MVEERLGMKFFERHAGVEKAANVTVHQNWRAVFNSLVICFFANVPPLTVLDLVNAATGRDFTLESLLQVGERAWNLKRLINNRFGLTRANDKLPKPLMVPYTDGGSAGYQIPLDEMLEAYYAVRGWDQKTGYPTREKLNELGLDWVEIME
jgi:aldehyde:ferredoxin oxidoreductase